MHSFSRYNKARSRSFRHFKIGERMSMSINPLTSRRMQAQSWRTRRGRGEGCHPFFPFSSVFHHFISFVVLLYEIQMKNPISVKHRLRTVVFTTRSFHMTSPNSNQETIDSSEFLLSSGIAAPENLYLHKFSVPKASSFSIEDA